MLEGQSELRLAEQFDRLMTLSVSSAEAPEEWRADLCLSENLRGINLGVESQIQARLRRQLAEKMQTAHIRPSGSAFPVRSLNRIGVSTLIVVLLLLVLVSNTPARAAIGHLFGYGYLPYAGFVPLSDTKMIEGAVTQSEKGQVVTILQGIQDQQKTILWIGTNLDSSELSKAEIVLPDQTRLSARSVQPDKEAVMLIFDVLPHQANSATLVLPAGWKLPLRWVNTDQAGLAPTQVSVPFQTNTPGQGQSQPPCTDLEHDIQICVHAAFTDERGTNLLLQAFHSGKTAPLMWSSASSWQAVALQDQAGQIYPIHHIESSADQDPSIVSILFKAVPPDVKNVSLHFPIHVIAAQENTDWPSQAIDLPLHLPDRVPSRSPTPSVLPSAPDHPINIPTPGINPLP